VKRNAVVRRIDLALFPREDRVRSCRVRSRSRVTTVIHYLLCNWPAAARRCYKQIGGEILESETHICDYCQDPKNPVNKDNGGAISYPAGGPTIAYVHGSCKEAWEQKQSVTRKQSVSTYERLKK